jgi:peptide/nickel transport system substrate-binding protein
MEPLRPEDPRQVGRYRLEARLGSGGMGQVFLGFSPSGRPMAVKVVHPELARDREFLHRFRQEVAAARRVSGAYTAPVVDAGDGDRPWLATTLVAGPSLADAVEQQGPLPEVSVWRLAAGLAEALAEVHAVGLIHRDLKPSNVLLAADGPRVIDFGISRALDATGLTGTGMVVGTPSFMSPEQATGAPVGPSSDVFSLGGVLAFAATGAGPFGEGSLAALVYRVVHGEPALDRLPGPLAAMIRHCLAKRPEDRPTPAELMELTTTGSAPVRSVTAGRATAFWPERLALFIGSYQDRVSAVPGERPVTAPRPAAIGAPAAGAAEVTSTAAAADVASAAQEVPAILTRQATVPPPPLTAGWAATAAAPTPTPTPPPVPARPEPPPSSPPSPAAARKRWLPAPGRRRALTAGLGTLAAAALAIILVMVTSSSPPGRSRADATPARPTGSASAASSSVALNPVPTDGFGAIPAASGTPHPGTVRYALAGPPDWILPLVPVAYSSVSNVTAFEYQLWRPLYWPDQGAAPAIDQSRSLARPPAWSDGGKTVTIRLNPRYTWSDGKPVSSADVAFDIELIRAAVKENPRNWNIYAPGEFPDNLAAMSTPDARTLVLHLTSAPNPSWFYQDELAALSPLPAHAWARASAGGPLLNAADPATAKKIYDYLAGQSKDTASWAASPLWRVVDGPYRLSSSYRPLFNATLVANPRYGGPSSHQITKLIQVSYPSAAAAFQALRAGKVDIAAVPYPSPAQLSQVRAAGYNVFGYPDFALSYAPYNFKDTTGHFDRIVSQLYFRQAMAHLQDQQGYIRDYMGGAGAVDYGPVSSAPRSQYAPNHAADAYPYSAATARSLLAAHGWKVTPGGTDTCVKPGTGAGRCGAGIPAGTKLAFNLAYDSGSTLASQEMHALAAAARQAGIAIALQQASYEQVFNDYNNALTPSNHDKWAMTDTGPSTQYLYPTTNTAFNTGGIFNSGGYSDPEADRLISASIHGTNPDAVTSEAAYLTEQQPGLFQPVPDVVYAWKKKLSGPPDSFASLTQFYLTPEAWYYTS